MEPGVAQVFGRHVKLPVLSAGKRNFAMVIIRTIADGLEEFVTTAADNESFRVIFNAGQGLIPRFTGLSGKFPNDGGGRNEGSWNKKIGKYGRELFFLPPVKTILSSSWAEGVSWRNTPENTGSACGLGHSMAVFPLIIPVLHGVLPSGRPFAFSRPCRLTFSFPWNNHSTASGMAIFSRYSCFIKAGHPCYDYLLP